MIDKMLDDRPITFAVLLTAVIIFGSVFLGQYSPILGVGWILLMALWWAYLCERASR